MKNTIKSSLLVILVIGLSSCASDYPCGEPRAGRCSSMTQNYQNAQHNIVNPEDLPVNGSYSGCTSGGCGSGSSASNSSYSLNPNRNFPQAYANGSPLISTPSMMRVWYGPYIDSDNVFHDQEYQYMITDRGHWLAGTNKVFGRNLNGYASTTTLVQSTNDGSTDATTVNQPQNPKSAAMGTAQQGANSTNSLANSNSPALNFLKNSAANQQPQQMGMSQGQ